MPPRRSPHRLSLPRAHALVSHLAFETVLGFGLIFRRDSIAHSPPRRSSHLKFYPSRGHRTAHPPPRRSSPHRLPGAHLHIASQALITSAALITLPSRGLFTSLTRLRGAHRILIPSTTRPGQVRVRVRIRFHSTARGAHLTHPSQKGPLTPPRASDPDLALPRAAHPIDPDLALPRAAHPISPRCRKRRWGGGDSAQGSLGLSLSACAPSLTLRTSLANC
jgi:hypothetical protein